MVSVAYPGVKGTMIRIGLDGKACARTWTGSNVQRLAKPKDAAISERFFIKSPFV
jgi:hypothetical protein